MNNKYTIEQVINGRWAVWYKNFPNGKYKLGVWKIIDLYSGTREKRFAFKKKVKGTEKTQEQLNEQIVSGTIHRFYRKNTYRGTQFERQTV